MGWSLISIINKAPKGDLKSKKKKKAGSTGGDVLDAEIDDDKSYNVSGFGTIKESVMDEDADSNFEEEKVNNNDQSYNHGYQNSRMPVPGSNL